LIYLDVQHRPDLRSCGFDNAHIAIPSFFHSLKIRFYLTYTVKLSAATVVSKEE